MKEVLSSILTCIHPAPTFFDYGFRSQSEMEMFDQRAVKIVRMAYSCISHAQLNNVDRYYMQNLFQPFRNKKSDHIQSTLKDLGETIGFVRGQINSKYVNAQMAIDQNNRLITLNN